MVIKDKGTTQDKPANALYSDYCFLSRKHCLKQRASILACNIIAVLLTRWLADNGHLDLAITGLLLTVARQPVIYTRFLFNSR